MPDVSAMSGVPRRQAAKSSAVSKDPVRTMPPRPRGPPGGSRPARRGNARGGVRRPGCRRPRQAATAAKATAGVWGAGFRTTALPAASAASAPPIGMASGKFQGPMHGHHAERRAPTAPSRRSSCAGQPRRSSGRSRPPRRPRRPPRPASCPLRRPSRATSCGTPRRQLVGAALEQGGPLGRRRPPAQRGRAARARSPRTRSTPASSSCAAAACAASARRRARGQLTTRARGSVGSVSGSLVKPAADASRRPAWPAAGRR